MKRFEFDKFVIDFLFNLLYFLLKRFHLLFFICYLFGFGMVVTSSENLSNIHWGLFHLFKAALGAISFRFLDDNFLPLPVSPSFPPSSQFATGTLRWGSLLGLLRFNRFSSWFTGRESRDFECQLVRIFREWFT